MLPLVLYDVSSKFPGKIWSPNPEKTRFILGYKNIPFDTVWVEYPDIEHTIREIGASPNKVLDGKERYTVPTIIDPNTGAVVTDSWTIAVYLDKTYPERPIFPPGSQGLISAFDSALLALTGDALRFPILRALEHLNERSAEYFTRIREAAFGVKVDEWSPEGPTRDAHWATFENSYYASAKVWYDKVEGKWLMGDTFSYADIILAIRTRWLKRVCHDHEWKRIASLHDGKWVALLEDVERECHLA